MSACRILFITPCEKSAKMDRRPKTIHFWQGRLPHWEVEDGRYFVTIHLAGAISEPGRQRILTLANEFKQVQTIKPDACLRRNRQIFSELEKWLDDATHVSHLTHPDVAEMVLEAIRHRDQRI